MGDEWQMEAVKEQFKVLNSAGPLQKDLNICNVRAVENAVSRVIIGHVRVNVNKDLKKVRHISAEIIKNGPTGNSDGNVKFGFCIIVTDERVYGQLSKIPVFIIQFGDNIVFIDMSCYSFKTWDAFMQHSEKLLPSCNFCFPVKGRYIDNKRLKIDFATSNKRSLLQTGWFKLVGLGLGIGSVAATFLFNIKPALDFVTSLIPLAKEFLPNFNFMFVDVFTQVLKKINHWKEGKIAFLKLAPDIFKLLNVLHGFYKEQIDHVAQTVKIAFKKVWNYLENMFGLFFNHKSSPFRLLALTTTHDETVIGSEELNELRQNNLATSQLFENCRNESAFHYQNGKEKSENGLQDLTPYKKDIVCMTADIARKSLCQEMLSHNDKTNMFQRLQTLVYDEKNERLKLYYRCRNAAETCSAGHELDIEKYNKLVGIKGDPETYFLKEAIEHVGKLYLQFSMNKKCIELVEKKSVQLIKCKEVPNNKQLGLYRCIGMGKGFVDANEFIKAINKIVPIDELSLIKKEEDNGQITIMTKELCIFIGQQLDEDQHSEGFMAMLENT